MPRRRFHVASRNAGKGKPLMLLLHGFPELWYSWRHQLAAFGDGYEVAALDLRGYGDSDKPKARAVVARSACCRVLPQPLDPLAYRSPTLSALRALAADSV